MSVLSQDKKEDGAWVKTVAQFPRDCTRPIETRFQDLRVISCEGGRPIVWVADRDHLRGFDCGPADSTKLASSLLLEKFGVVTTNSLPMNESCTNAKIICTARICGLAVHPVTGKCIATIGHALVYLTAIERGQEYRDFCILAGNLEEPGEIDGTASIARFEYPSGIAYDTYRKRWLVGDSNTIRSVYEPSGQKDVRVETFARMQRQDHIIALHGVHSLLVVDMLTCVLAVDGYRACIDALDLDTGQTIWSAGHSVCSLPYGLAFDSELGHLYVSDHPYIRRCQLVETLAPALFDSIQLPATLSSLIAAYAVCFSSGSCAVLNVIAGNPIYGLKDGASESARFAQPNGIDICQRSRLLYVWDSANHAIRTVTLPAVRPYLT